MGHSIDSLRTHSPMENDTTTAIDDSPLLGQHSGALSNYGANFDSPKEVGINAEEGSNSKPVILTSRWRYKRIAKMIVKPTAICKPLFVSQCLTQFPKITHQERLVANFALAKDGDPRYFTLVHHILFMWSNFFSAFGYWHKAFCTL